MAGPYLFFYGVLLGDIAPPRVRELLRGIGQGQPAHVTGDLYAVTGPNGAYPVLLPGEGVVHGNVHEAGNVDLAALDAFEGVDPNDPLAGEYRREAVIATLADGSEIEADAYLWNRSASAADQPIPHGDFARWLKDSGLQPFGS